MNVNLKKISIEKPHVKISTPHYIAVEKIIEETDIPAGISALLINQIPVIIGNFTFSEIGG